MRKELIIDAIGNISDRHIMEFADVNSLAIVRRRHIFSMVACICLIVTLSIVTGLFFKKELSSPGNSGEIIWGESDWHEYEDTTKGTETAELGVVKVSDSLAEAFANSDSESDIFAIKVYEINGMDNIDVYQQFILKLGVKETYLENGLVFATKKQVASFKCPTNMSIVLYLADKTEKEIIIDRDNINKFDSDIFLVTIHLEDDIEGVLQEIEDYEKILSTEEYQMKRLSVIQENVENTINVVLNDYNITDDELIIKGKFMPYFRVELTRETIVKLLEDNRVGIIIMHEESESIINFDKIFSP